ncbi:hypothetical protein NIES39_E00990 [Arthrospira platensis NIES-39]|nr:hypothetical protein NIES39_E00990 [Arthrospira platensis NIES-39]
MGILAAPKKDVNSLMRSGDGGVIPTSINPTVTVSGNIVIMENFCNHINLVRGVIGGTP